MNPKPKCKFFKSQSVGYSNSIVDTISIDGFLSNLITFKEGKKKQKGITKSIDVSSLEDSKNQYFLRSCLPNQ